MNYRFHPVVVHVNSFHPGGSCVAVAPVVVNAVAAAAAKGQLPQRQQEPSTAPLSLPPLPCFDGFRAVHALCFLRVLVFYDVSV